MNKDRLKHYASTVKRAALGLDRIIVARVAGVTFEGRQDHLANVGAGTELRLERDRRNKYDFHAVGVWARIGPEATWEHVGFIPSTMSKLISKSLDNGVDLSVSVHRRTGGMVNEETGKKLNYGLEIKIAPPGITDR